MSQELYSTYLPVQIQPQERSKRAQHISYLIASLIDLSSPEHVPTRYLDAAFARRRLHEITLTTIQEGDQVFKAKLYRWESVGIKKLLRGAELDDSTEHGDLGKEDTAALARKAPGLERATCQHAEKKLPTIHEPFSAVYNPVILTSTSCLTVLTFSNRMRPFPSSLTQLIPKRWSPRPVEALLDPY
jgi:hypothetical protein